MSNYTIKANETWSNSHEVYFDNKPEITVIKALKAAGMRWNPKKQCWYGFKTERELIDIIQSDTDSATVYTDGYLGGGGFYGSRSRKHLYGAELSKAIREQFKAEGLKGCSVRVSTYSGGQRIKVTVTAQSSDYNDYETFCKFFETDTFPCLNWLDWRGDDGEFHQIYRDSYYELDADEQHKVYNAVCKEHYSRNTGDINHHNIESERDRFTAAFIEKLKRINSIILSFNYDESNSMVDYFETNFYYDIAVKRIA